MSDTDPIARSSDLGRLLDADVVPALSEGFADRIAARTKDRAPPLPDLRSRREPSLRWRSARRLTIAALGAGALATAAAATGVLKDWGVSIPGVQSVWASLSGEETPSDEQLLGDSDVEVAGDPIPAFAPQIRRAAALEGPIDTPEELEEAFKRFDRAREGMKETRRRNVDRRIEEVIERRRANGLPVPTPAQEQRIRGRIERARESRDARSALRREERREALLEKIENGEEITAEDLRPGGGEAVQPRLRERIERLRALPREERREQLQQWRERRQERRNRRNASQPATPQEQTQDAQSEQETAPDNPPLQ